MDENNLPTWQKDKLKKRILKLRKQNRLIFPKMDSKMIWRLCAADLMRGNFSRYLGWEYRSKWALDMSRMFPNVWDGYPCKLIIFAEQGIGDEILFASCFDDVITQCPDVTIEADDRLIPVFERSFGGRFISRWVSGVGHSETMQHQYEKFEDYDQYMTEADLLRMYRRSKPPGTPYLTADPERVGKFKEKFKSLGEPPYIGVSWRGGRSNLEPGKLVKKKGTYISLQYKREKKGEVCYFSGDPGPFHDVGLDHTDIEDVFACVEALDEVNTIQCYIVHVCGSLGKKCHAVKPPPQYGEVGFEESENNRLKWAYGVGKGAWKMPWYNSVTVYGSYRDL